MKNWPKTWPSWTSSTTRARTKPRTKRRGTKRTKKKKKNKKEKCTKTTGHQAAAVTSSEGAAQGQQGKGRHGGTFFRGVDPEAWELHPPARFFVEGTHYGRGEGHP